MPRETYVLRGGKLVAKRLAQPREAGPRLQIISDIEPYRAAAADKATGKRPVIGGRRQHREFLARNGYVEIGNETIAGRREEMSRSDRIADIRRAFGD